MADDSLNNEDIEYTQGLEGPIYQRTYNNLENIRSDNTDVNNTDFVQRINLQQQQQQQQQPNEYEYRQTVDPSIINAPVTDADSTLAYVGTLDRPAFKRIVEHILPGTGKIGTYTVEKGEVLDTVINQKFQVYASNREGRRVPEGVTELPREPYGRLAKYGEYGVFHGKPIRGTDVRYGEVGGVLTGNLTDTNINDRVKNYAIITRDPEVNRQLDKVFKNLSEGRPVYSDKDIIVTSPNDPKTGMQRVQSVLRNAVRNIEKGKETLYISSASLSQNSSMISFAAELLKQGVNLKIVRAADENDQSAYSSEDKAIESLKTLVSFSRPGTTGDLFVGRPTDGRRTHGTVIALKEQAVAYLGSARLSAATEQALNTEIGELFRGKRSVHHLVEDIEKRHSFEKEAIANAYQYETGFIAYVNQSRVLRDEQILIPSQSPASVREMHRKLGVPTGDSYKTGILTSTLTAYAQVAAMSSVYSNNAMAGVNVSDLELAEKIQRSWVESRSFGESWGQLGDRGFIATKLIKGAQWLNDRITGLYRTSSDIERSYRYGYRLKPVKEKSTFLADATRNILDFTTNMVTNTMGFFVFTGLISYVGSRGVKNRFLTITEALMSSRSGLVSGTGSVLRATGTGLSAVGYFIRSNVSGIFTSTLIPTLARPLDILTGQVGTSGSIQGFLERLNIWAQDPNRSTADVIRRSFVQFRRVSERNYLLRPLGLLSEGAITIQRGAGHLFTNIRQGISFGRALRTVISSATNRVPSRVYRIAPQVAGLTRSRGGFWMAALIGLIGVDRLTAYLGKNVNNGPDASDVDEMNRRLARAANAAGLHPVQLQRTTNSNLTITRIPFIDTAINSIRSIFNYPMFLIARTMDSITKHTRDKVINHTITYEGKNIEYAQIAASQGNFRLAEYFFIKGSGGEGLYDKNHFGSDLWKSWPVQISLIPQLGTLTWGMVQHSGLGEKGGFGYSFTPRDVQEFGFSIQGPVMLSLGLSIDLPFKMISYMRREDLQRKKIEKDWTYVYKPGTSFVSSLGAVTFLSGTSLIFSTLASGVERTLTSPNANVQTGLRSRIISGIRYFRELIEFGHVNVYEPTYIRGNVGIREVPSSALPRLAAGKAAFTAAASIVTVPLQLMYGLANALIINPVTTFFNTTGGSRATFSQLTGINSGSTLGLNQNVLDALRSTSPTSSRARESIRVALLGLTGGQRVGRADFDRHFLHVTGTDNRDNLYNAYRRLTRSSLNFPSIWSTPAHVGNTSRISRGISMGFRGFAIAFTVVSMVLSYQAAHSVYEQKNLEESWAFALANKFSTWIASDTQKTLASTAAKKNSPVYYLAENMNYTDGPEFFRSWIAAGRAFLHGIDNIRTTALGMAMEFLFGVAGFRKEDLYFNPVSLKYEAKVNSISTPGVFNLFFSSIANILRAFGDSKYAALSSPYIAGGSFFQAGITEKNIDKDTLANNGSFYQFTPSMFLSGGYAQQFILRASTQKMSELESKYVQLSVYNPFGIRMNFRTSPIRNSRMYKTDIADEAEGLGWSVQLELLRRSMLFKQVKYMDAGDLIFVPGLITKNSADQRYAVRNGIRTFKDVVSLKDEAFASLVSLFSSDAFKSNRDANAELSKTEQEVEYQQAMINQNEILSNRGVYFYSPITQQYNIISSMPVKIALGTLILAAVVSFSAAVIRPDGGFTSSVVQALQRRFFNGATIGEQGLNSARRLSTRRITYSSLRFGIVPFTGATGVSPLNAIFFGNNAHSLIFVKGDNYPTATDIDPNRSVDTSSDRAANNGRTRFRRYFWSSGEHLLNRRMALVVRTLNRINTMYGQVSILSGSGQRQNGFNDSRVRQFRNNLNALKSNLNSVVQDLVASGLDRSNPRLFSRINQIANAINAIDSTVTGSSVIFDNLQRALSSSDASILDARVAQSGVPQALEDLLDSTRPGSGRSLDRLILRAYTETGLIRDAGILGTNEFRLWMRRTLGVTRDVMERTLEAVTDFVENRSYHATRGTAQNPFNPSVTPPPPSAAPGAPGAPGAGGRGAAPGGGRRGSRAGTGTPPGNPPLGAALTPDEQRALNEVRVSMAAGVTSSEHSTLVNNAHRNRSPNATSASPEGPGLFRRIFSLGGLLTTASIVGTVAVVNAGIISPLKELAYLKLVSTSYDLNKSERDQVYRYTYEANSRLVAGSTGFVASFALPALVTRFAINPILSRFAGQPVTLARAGAAGFSAIGTAVRTLVSRFVPGLAGRAAATAAATAAAAAGGSAASTATATAAAAAAAGATAAEAAAAGTAAAAAAAGAAGAAAVGTAAAVPIGIALAGAAAVIGVSLAGFWIYSAVSDPIETALNRVDTQTKIDSGRRISTNDGYFFGIVNSVSKNITRINEYFENEARRLKRLELQNKLTNPLDILFNFVYKNIPGYRDTLDIIEDQYKNGYSSIPGLKYKLKGYSPSLRPDGHGTFFEKDVTVFFVGSAYDYGMSVMLPTQMYLPFQDSNAYTRHVLHSSAYGYIPSAKQVSSNKDGSDALGPTWMRDEYRSHMFRPPNLVQNEGLSAELNRRSDLMIQVIMNLNDQSKVMNRIFVYNSVYDPRSGGNMSPSRYLVTGVDPRNFGTGFIDLVRSADERSKDVSDNKQLNPPVGRPENPQRNIRDKQVSVPASKRKENLLNQIAKHIEKKSQEKIAKANSNYTNKGKVVTVASARKGVIEAHEAMAESSSIPRSFSQKGKREISGKSGNYVLPSAEKYERSDVEIMACADSFNAGADFIFNDTIS